MDTNKSACMDIVFVNEGGYVNNPKDPGGATRYGITERTARAHGYAGSMKELPKSVAEAIYTKSYWDNTSYKCSTLEPGVDLAVFDYGVNSGPGRSAKALKASAGGTAVDTVKKIFAGRMGFLRSLKTWATFGPGWTKRCTRTEAAAHKMALTASGKAPDEVKQGLQDEQKKAEDARNKSGTIGTTTGVGGTTQVPNVPADPSAFDWHTLLYVGTAVAVAGIVIYFAVKAYNNHQRASAFAAVAKEA